MIDNSEFNRNPLVTICCLIYNQEKYVADAIISLLSQDYYPLEIILSDDCSSDNTYSIMCNVLSEYSGKHKVILNRNSTNIGLIQHFNQCVAKAGGEYIYLAAGDDMSLPDRVSKTQEVWLNSYPQARAVFTNLMKIDSSGNELGCQFSNEPIFARNIKDVMNDVGCWAIGASLSFHRSLFDFYGTLPLNVIQEDGCIAFRAILDGGIDYLPDVSVLYRYHDNNLSQNLTLSNKVKYIRARVPLYRSFLKDACAKGLDGVMLNKIRRMILLARLQSSILSSKPIAYSIYYMRKLFIVIKKIL